MPKKVRPIPKGYHTVTASLNQANAAATIDFCKKAFGAKVRMNMVGPGNKIMHAEIEIGDSVVMLQDAMQEPPAPGSLFLYVENVDKTVAKGGEGRRDRADAADRTCSGAIASAASSMRRATAGRSRRTSRTSRRRT
jgi:uncharacterized glyoxalase superfamily protein PhnB